jgi:hypothetical protein
LSNWGRNNNLKLYRLSRAIINSNLFCMEEKFICKVSEFYQMLKLEEYNKNTWLLTSSLEMEPVLKFRLQYTCITIYVKKNGGIEYRTILKTSRIKVLKGLKIPVFYFYLFTMKNIHLFYNPFCVRKNIFFRRYILAIPCNVQLLLEVTVCTVHTQKKWGARQKVCKRKYKHWTNLCSLAQNCKLFEQKNIAWTKSFI